MFGFRTLLDAAAFEDPEKLTGGGSNGGGSASTEGWASIQVPPAVWQYFAALAGTDTNKLVQMIQQWQKEQWGLQTIAGNIQPGWQQIDGTHWVDERGRVFELQNEGKFKEWTISESKAYLDSVAASGGGGSGGGGGGGASTTRLSTDDPRYWQLQYDQLDSNERIAFAQVEAQLRNAGLDAESARRQALVALIQSRNNMAVDVGQLSANVAKQVADFAANPRDAVAELMYRNQVGGSTPFGDLTNNNFGEYGKALAEKASNIFQPVAQDIQQARVYRDSIPQAEFFGPEVRQQLGLPLTTAQVLANGGTGGGSSPLASAAAPAPTQVAPPVTGTDLLAGKLFQQEQAKDDFAKKLQLPKFDMGGVINARSGVGDAPTSSEGGLNLNLFEPAMVVGMDSGKVYATLAEPRPDGTRRGEQLVVKPLKSEVEKDKKLAEGEKAVTQSFGVPKAAQGGTINSTPDDFMDQLRQYLGSLGGSGGGTGAVSSPLQSPRLLAGSPYNRLLEDPDAMSYAESGFSALGISPNNLHATIKKFTPNAPINNAPRVNWLG